MSRFERFFSIFCKLLKHFFFYRKQKKNTLKLKMLPWKLFKSLHSENQSKYKSIFEKSCALKKKQSFYNFLAFLLYLELKYKFMY